MKSSAVFLLGALVSWACAIPVMFISYEEGENGNPKLLECVTTEGSKQKLSYKCRMSNKTPPLQQQGNNIPVLEILKETVRENDKGVTEVEVSEEILFPAAGGPPSVAERYEVIQEPSRARTKKNRGGCDDDEVFVAELDICVPYAPHKVDPKIAKVEDEDDSVSLIDPTHTILKVGFKKLKCPPGEIEIIDLGICAPINNCWPHPDCSHLDQNKDKNKNTRVEADKDDD